MTDFSTREHLQILLKTIGREMANAQVQEVTAPSDSPLGLTADFFRGVQCGLAFAAGGITSHLDSLGEVDA